MPLFAAFCAGASAERSRSMDAARTVNLFRSSIESEDTATKAYLLGTPGLRAVGELAGASCRGTFTEDGRTWSTVGTTLYELTINATTGAVTGTARGTILDDGFPVSYATNGDGGQQLAIVGGGQLKILNLLTNVLSGAVLLPLTRPPVMIGFLDAYFVLQEKDSLLTWFSAIENGLVWDALDFFTRSTASDHTVGMVCANSRIWLFGSETTEAYEDVGDADNPFQPIKGSLFQIGCVGTWTISLGVSTIRWVGKSKIGGPAIYRLDGYAGTRISTHATELALAKATTLVDAEALTYEQEGHLFYCLTCPSAGLAGETYVIDESEHGQPHQRSAWNQTLGREEPWRVRGHVYVGQRHLVGSRDNGKIWHLDLDTYDDDGAILRAVRRAPYLGAENAWATIDRVELGIEMGVGLNAGQGSDPQVELRYSKNNGKTWDSAGTAAIGKIGAYDDTGAYWTRLGRARIDRLVLEVVITDPVKRAIGPGLWLSLTAGKAAA